MIVLLDSGPLGLVTHPNATRGPALACSEWLEHMLDHGVVVHVPEIADYETRREALRRRQDDSLRNLDELAESLGLVPITTAVLHRAAELWAQARQRGRPTADPAALDGDVILAAQAQLLSASTGDEVIVPTDNLGHLGQFVDARPWQEIAAP